MFADIVYFKKKFCITFTQSSFQYSLIFLLVFVSAFLCFTFPDESYCKSRFSYTVILKRHQRLKVFFFFIFMSLTVTKVTCVYVKRRVNLFFFFLHHHVACLILCYRTAHLFEEAPDVCSAVNRKHTDTHSNIF